MSIGNSSPYYKIQYVSPNKNLVDISSLCTRFEYIHAEEEDDTCTIELKLINPAMLDLPAFNHRSKWLVEWGFMGGDKKSLPVYLEETMPEFDEHGVKVVLTLHDKFSNTKKQTSRSVIGEEVSLPEVARRVAKENGMTPLISRELVTSADSKRMDNIKLEGVKTVVNADPNNRFNFNAYKKQQQRYEDKSEFVEIAPGVKKDKYDIYPELEKLAASATGVKGLIETKQITTTPQLRNYLYQRSRLGPTLHANKTKAQVLSEMAKTYNTVNPVVVTGHGDNLYVKLKGVNKAPILSFRWGGGDGNLLTFKPETKYKTQKAAATNQAVSSWDALSKTAFISNLTSQANSQLNSKKATPANSESSLRDGYVRIRAGEELPDGRVSALSLFEKGSNKGTRGLFINASGGITSIDNTAGPALTNIRLVRPEVSQDTDTQAVITPGDVLSAIGRRSTDLTETEWNITPGTFRCFGNPLVLSGEVIELTNLTKKYSGNYYIVKATHLIEPTSGYVVNAEVVKSEAKKNYSIKSGSDPIPESRIKSNPS